MGDDSQPIVRATGKTASERYLSALCDRTFLSLWSYPTVCRDQKAASGGDGKEVCDLLVLFGDHVVIFSDKSCEFKPTADPSVGWARWYKKAVQASIRQIYGAEQWLREFPHHIYLDPSCQVPFPLPIPNREALQVHRVVVARNIAEPCRQTTGRRSLRIDNQLTISQRHSNGMPPVFTVGISDPSDGFVHVLDDIGLDIVLENRNTIKDFTDYLTAKETFLRRSDRIVVDGEQELLACYLRDYEGEEHIFPKKTGRFYLAEGDWDKFQVHPQRLNQLKADRDSYLWDQLIERFNTHILGRTLFRSSHTDLRSNERPVRMMAAESRLRRRVLVRSYIELMRQRPATDRMTRVVVPESDQFPTYVLLLLRQPSWMEDKDYRPFRQVMLLALCDAVKVRSPKALDIVGIATDHPQPGADCSEDVCYLDAREWTDEDEQRAREDMAALRLLTNVTESRRYDTEYPMDRLQACAEMASVKNPRNKRCPCGSGLKFKRCCGGPPPRQ